MYIHVCMHTCMHVCVCNNRCTRRITTASDLPSQPHLTTLHTSAHYHHNHTPPHYLSSQPHLTTLHTSATPSCSMRRLMREKSFCIDVGGGTPIRFAVSHMAVIPKALSLHRPQLRILPYISVRAKERLLEKWHLLGEMCSWLHISNCPRIII